MENGSDVRDFVSHWRQDPTGREDELVVAKVKYESVARVARWRDMKRVARDEDEDEDAAQGIVEGVDGGDEPSPGGFSDSERQYLRHHCRQERSPVRRVRPQSASNTRRVGDLQDRQRRVGSRRPLSANACRRGGDLSSPQRKIQQLTEFAWMPPAIQRSKWTEMLHSSPSFQEQSLKRLEEETYALLKQVLQKGPSAGVRREKKTVKVKEKRSSVETGAPQFSAGGRSLAVGSGLQVVRKSKSDEEKAETKQRSEKLPQATSTDRAKKTTPTIPPRLVEKKAHKVEVEKKKQKPKLSQQSQDRVTKPTAQETKLTDKELKKRHADAEGRLRLMQEMGWLDDIGIRKPPPQTETEVNEEPSVMKKPKKTKATTKSKTKVFEATQEGLGDGVNDDDVDSLITELLLEVPRELCCVEAALSDQDDETWPESTLKVRGDRDEASSHGNGDCSDALMISEEGKIEPNVSSRPDNPATLNTMDEEHIATEIPEANGCGSADDINDLGETTSMVASGDVSVKKDDATHQSEKDSRSLEACLCRVNTDRYDDEAFEEEPTLKTTEEFHPQEAGMQAAHVSLGHADAHMEEAAEEKQTDARVVADQVTLTVSLSSRSDQSRHCEADLQTTAMEEITVCQESECSEQPVVIRDGAPPNAELDSNSESARTIQRQYRAFLRRRLLLDQVAFLAQKQRRQKRKISRRKSSSAVQPVTEADLPPPTLEKTPLDMSIERFDVLSEISNTTSARGEEAARCNVFDGSSSVYQPQDEVEDVRQGDQDKSPSDCGVLDQLLDSPADGPNILSTRDDNESHSVDNLRVLVEAFRDLPAAPEDEEVGHGTDGGDDGSRDTADTAVGGKDDHEMASLLPSDFSRTCEEVAFEGELAAPDSVSVTGSVYSSFDHVDQSSSSISEDREACGVAESGEFETPCCVPRTQPPEIPVESVASLVFEVYGVAAETSNHKEPSHESFDDAQVRSDDLLADAVTVDEGAADQIGSSSSATLAAISDETLDFISDEGGFHPSASVEGCDREDSSKMNRAKAAERIQQCWKAHCNADKCQSVAGDQACLQETQSMDTGIATRPSAVVHPETQAIPVHMVNVDVSATDDNEGLDPPSKELVHIETEDTVLVSDVDSSDAVTPDHTVVARPAECVIHSADETSVSVSEDGLVVEQAVIDDQASLMGPSDEGGGGDPPVPPSQHVDAVVRIQCQYRRFVYRRAILDQLTFLVRQHRRESRRKTRRLSAAQADVAVASAEVEPFNVLVRPETVSESALEEPETTNSSAETAEAEVQLTPLDLCGYVEGRAERSLLDAAFESEGSTATTEGKDDGNMKTAKTEAVEGKATLANSEANTMDAVSSVGLATEADNDLEQHHHETEEDKRALKATWERYIDTSANKSFYFHATRRVSQWDRPVDEVVLDKTTDQLVEPQATAVIETVVTSNDEESTSQQPQPGPLSPSRERWERYMDSDTNKSFYFHPKRKVSRWDSPDQESIVDCIAAAAAPQSEPGRDDGDAHVDEATQLLGWWRHVKEQAALLETNGGWDRCITREDAVVFYHHAGRDEFCLESDAGVPLEFTEAKAALLRPVLEATGEDKSSRWTLRRNRSIKGDKRGEWQAFVDTETHQTFYYNTLTSESTWEKPPAFNQPTTEPPASFEWVMYVDPTTSQPFYVNLATNATSWEKPPDFDQATSDQDLSRLRGISEHSLVAAPMTEDEEPDEYVISIHDDRAADEWLAG